MAITTVTKLSMTFTTADGTTTISYNYADPNVSVQNVNALMAGIITNGSIFAKVPLAAKSAKIVTTQTTDVNISE